MKGFTFTDKKLNETVKCECQNLLKELEIS